jgi:Trypsin-like peptidase domain
MIPLRLTALSATILIGIAPGPASAWVKAQIGDILELSKAGLVKIIVTGRSTNNKILTDYGSAFVVTSDGFVISAAHLLSHKWQDMTVSGRLAYLNNDDVSQRDKLTDLEIIYKDDGTDIALLRFVDEPEGLRALPLRSAVPSGSEPLFIMGFPGGQSHSTHYQVTFEGLESEHRFQFQGVANFGNSGGPILDQNGYVVGIDLEVQAKKNGVPITNTYLAALTKDFPVPKGFKLSTIRPLFQDPEKINDGQFSSVWNEARVKRYLTYFSSTEQQKFCNVSIPSDWLVRRDPTRGFLVAPPSQSDLFKAPFKFEFSVKKREDYVAQQERREASGEFGPTPFHFIPLGNQTLFLSDIDAVRRQSF